MRSSCEALGSGGDVEVEDAGALLMKEAGG